MTDELSAALKKRKETLTQLTAVKNLPTLGDMAEALLLPDWADDQAIVSDTMPTAFTEDREVRETLFKRFVGEVKSKIHADDPPLRAAVATLVGEFGVSTRNGFLGVKGNNKIVMERLPELTAVLAGVAKDDTSREVRIAAAAALAKVQSERTGTVAGDNKVKPVTVPALQSLLTDSNAVEVRRAGAAALRDLLRSTPVADRTGSVSSPAAPQSSTNLPQFGPQVAQAAGEVLRSSERDPEVRRLCAETLLEVAKLVDPRLNLYTGMTTYEKRGQSPHTEMEPVVKALWKQTEPLSQATRDPDPMVRLTAIHTLEQMGNVGYHWFHPQKPIEFERPPESVPRPSPGKISPRAELTPDEDREVTLVAALVLPPPEVAPFAPSPLKDAIKPLVAVMQTGNLAERLAAIDALETITARNPENPQPLAKTLEVQPTAEAARALTQALSDQNRFVRWAATRTLGRMAPLYVAEDGKEVKKDAGDDQKLLLEAERDAVLGLTRLLSDADPDVRLRVAVALAQFGDAARPAVRALADASTRGDVPARLAATVAIEWIGGSADRAVPALALSLTDQNVRLRRAAASALGSYGSAARPALSVLNRALRDPDPEVRRLASDAIIRMREPQ
jgi:HEAT repeat protein